MQLLTGGSRELFEVLAAQKRTEERVAMSETPAYKPEKFVSIGELLVKLVLKKVNYYNLWFKCCQ